MKSKFRQLYALAVILIISASLTNAQKVTYIKIPDLERILNAPDDKLFVVNFWATWCAPCVSELPGFEKVAREYESGNVTFIMISLDFPSQVEKQLIPFLKKNKISLDIPVMTDVDYNAWIDKVDPSWQGNIPATLLFNNSKKTRHFHPGEIDESSLRELIKLYI